MARPLTRAEAQALAVRILAEARGLSEWEQGFLGGLGESHLTPRQEDKLREIAQQYGIPVVEGATISEEDLWR